MKDLRAKTCVCILLLLIFVPSSRSTATAVAAPPASNEFRIPRGRAILVDGFKSPGEWTDASITQFSVAPGWYIRVFAKHDAEYLYFDFEGVTHGGKRLFPEILLDPRNVKSAEWQKGQWWLHVSNNLCEGNGAPNIFEKHGKFQCAHIKPGWDGNNPPEAHTELIEIKISFSKLGVQFSPGMKIGLAFNATDATGNAAQDSYYWPASAKIDSPKTWSTATIE
jgi:hypothetical protein